MASGVARSIIASLTSSGVACGCFSKYTAAAPATEGAAMDYTACMFVCQSRVQLVYSCMHLRTVPVARVYALSDNLLHLFSEPHAE